MFFLNFLTDTIIHDNVFSFIAMIHLEIFYIVLATSSQTRQLTNANYCSSHVTQRNTTIKYIIVSVE